MRVDEQAEAIYRRTIIHLDPHAVLTALRDFPHAAAAAKLSARGAGRGLPIWRTAITMSIICSAVTRRL